MRIDDSEERLIRRLEAFSDVVIGFSLAQVGTVLVVPAFGEHFHLHALPIFGFVVTFATICMLWWSHHKLFTNYFVPVMPSVILNFASLGGVIFVVYSLQVWLHAGPHDSSAYELYFAAFGWVCAALAVQYAIALHLRGATMTRAAARNGRRTVLRLSGQTALFAFAATFMGTAGVNSPAAVWLPIPFFVWSAVLRARWRREDRYEAAAIQG